MLEDENIHTTRKCLENIYYSDLKAKFIHTTYKYRDNEC